MTRNSYRILFSMIAFGGLIAILYTESVGELSSGTMIKFFIILTLAHSLIYGLRLKATGMKAAEILVTLIIPFKRFKFFKRVVSDH